MVNSVEKYLEILYPNIEDIDDEQYKKDKAFLETYLPQFEMIYQKYSEFRDEVPESIFIKDVLRNAKRKYDPETKIAHFAGAMLEALETNDIFVQKFDVLMRVINNDSLENLQTKNSEKETLPITIESVYELVGEFLEKIDPGCKLQDKFENLIYDGKVELIASEDEGESRYSHNEGKIYYKFDGTVNTAHTLIHEFMHHISYKEAQTNMGYYEFTLFREFLSIYYEKAFIQFMDEKGMLPNGKEPLLAERIKRQRQEDPEHCLPLYLELSHKYMEKQSLEKEDILLFAEKYFPDIKTKKELWEHVSKILVDFSDEHYFGIEVGAGLTTYMFSTVMAYETKCDEETLGKMYNLAGHVKNGKNDIDALEEYFKFAEETEKEFIDKLGEDKGISVQQIGRRSAKMPGITNIIDVEKKIFLKWKNKELEKGGNTR